MAVNNPRNRVLIFRLTQEEYAELHAASMEQGARSLSDFARTKLLAPRQTLDMGKQLADLKTVLVRVAELLEDDRPAPALLGQPPNSSSAASIKQQ